MAGEASITSELVAGMASLLMLAVYLLVWSRSVQTAPLRTTRGVMQAARRSWVSASMQAGMLPVNTLRDLIRTNQFYASSSLVVALGAAGFATSTEGMLHFKVISLVAANAITFCLFLQAVRFYTHLEILINTPSLAEGIPVTDKATRFGAAGQKALMLTFPLLLWLSGPLALVLATLTLVAAFRALDYDEAGHRVISTLRVDGISTRNGGGQGIVSGGGSRSGDHGSRPTTRVEEAPLDQQQQHAQSQAVHAHETSSALEIVIEDVQSAQIGTGSL
jgi:uncharacterized membrane protein